jgi:orotate phosphoribosyltransferase
MDSLQIAKILVECGAVDFRTDPPFRFTSGAESPIYVDNRHLLGFVDARRALVAALAEAASDEVGRINFDAVAGTATAGIPWAAWLADYWALPLLYVRSNAKEWGMENSVEGRRQAGWRAVVVEDLLYTGGSAVTSVERLRDTGLEVDTCICIVTYNIPASRAIEAAGVEIKALTTVEYALAAAVSMGRLSDAQGEIVAEWLAEKQS